jgi:imidazolonepropionase-like amidohydrolase
MLRFLGLILLSSSLFANDILLQPKSVLDVVSGKLISSDVLIKDGKIVKVGTNIKASQDTQVIKLKDVVLIPGLMDSHVHLIGDTSKKGYASIGNSTYFSTIHGVKNAYETLRSGFTTVRMVGAPEFADVALKKAINEGTVKGPRLLVSGPPLGISGGHCDSNLFPYSKTALENTPHQIVDNPWDARKAVRINRKFGADLIKFCATGGVMSKNTDVNAKQFTYEEMEAIVSEAHNHGMKVAAHAHGLEGIKTAIRAGVDSIEHSSFIDNETIQLAIEKGTYLSMDIYVSDYILGEGAKKGILEESLEKERTVGKIQRMNFKQAVEAGAKITFGTDAGIFPHGDNKKQFKYMVEWGMTPLQAIQAATINTAELFGLNDIGRIEEGYFADIVGINGNPLNDITLLESATFVMKEGEIILQ